MQIIKINKKNRGNVILKIKVDTVGLASTQINQYIGSKRVKIQEYIFGNNFQIDLGSCSEIKDCWVQIKTIVDFRTQDTPVQKYKIEDSFDNTESGIANFLSENQIADSFQHVVRNYTIKAS